MLFPEKLRQLRAASGLKQKEVAKRIGVDIPMYSRFEHGERRPKRDTVVRLAKIFNTDVEELVALWLAFAAINEIGTDKLADKALGFLREELGETPAPAASPAPVAAPAEASEASQVISPYHIEVPVIDQARQNYVKQLGGNPFPQYYLGDALQTLTRVESDSIDCIITCPPDWNLRRYDTESILVDPVEEDMSQILSVMGQLHRVLKPSGSLWLNMGDAYHNKELMALPWRMALQMIDRQGWILRNDVVWDKQNSAFDSSSNRLRNTHEFIFHFVKSEDFYYNDEELRIFFNHVAEKKSKEGKTNSGVTGSKYRRNLASSTALSPQEKENAFAELEKVVKMVNDGEIPDFRMFIRSFPGQVLDSKSEKAKSINEKGYYFLLYNKHGIMPGDVWNIPAANSTVDCYNVFPEPLCHMMILSTCPEGGIVLDPYCGLGTACKVAYDLHRRSIGIDVNEFYLRKAKETIQQQQLTLF